MLFLDGTISTIEDLAAYETAVMDTAGVEGIDLTRKLELARTEIGVDLAVLADDLDVAKVIVTAPLRLWHTFRTLELVYRDAYYNQLNDRYRAKWEQYRLRAISTRDKVMVQGIGVASDPVPRAQPVSVMQIPFAVPATTYYVSGAWVNRNGEEGAPSSPVAVATEGGRTISVLPPPAPANAAGWNVYVGYSADRMSRQNGTTLASDQGWSLLAAVPGTGAAPGEGQEPNYYRPLARILQRG